ncbi:hypothetical protein [Nesterenkonia suensis]
MRIIRCRACGQVIYLPTTAPTAPEPLCGAHKTDTPRQAEAAAPETAAQREPVPELDKLKRPQLAALAVRRGLAADEDDLQGLTRTDIRHMIEQQEAAQ